MQRTKVTQLAVDGVLPGQRRHVAPVPSHPPSPIPQGTGGVGPRGAPAPSWGCAHGSSDVGTCGSTDGGRRGTAWGNKLPFYDKEKIPTRVQKVPKTEATRGREKPNQKRTGRRERVERERGRAQERPKERWRESGERGSEREEEEL